MPIAELSSTGRSSRPRHRALRAGACAWADADLARCVDMTTSTPPAARLVAALGRPAGCKRRVPAAYGGLHRDARRAHAVPGARDAGLSRRPRRFRLRHAGARHRPIALFGSAELKAALSAAGRATARPSPRSRSPSRKPARTSPRMATTATPDGAGYVRHRRREDLDLQRRHRRPLRGVRPHRRGARREGPLRLRGRCRHAGSDDRRAHRRDRAASARDLAVRELPRAG